MIVGRYCKIAHGENYIDVEKAILRIKRLSKKNTHIIYYQLVFTAFAQHMVIVEAVSPERSWFWIIFPSAFMIAVLNDDERRGVMRGEIALSAQKIFCVKFDWLNTENRDIYKDLM